jgi:sulfur carrier protein
MVFLINGDQVNVPERVKTVEDLLTHFQLEKKVLIVELNQQIIEKSLYAETLLADGDRVEIVHFVGGG